MNKILCGFLLAFVCSSVFALNAVNNGDWMSVGIPNYIHIGTDGKFYLQGDEQGMCGGKTPQYLRMDMNAPHFKEFYSWLLFMSAQNKPIACTISHGCGQTEVWTTYCRGGL